MSIHALSLFVSSSKAHNWLSVVSYPVLFLALQILNDVGLSTDASLPFSSLDLAVIEALKLAFNVLVRFRSGEVEGPFRKTTQGRHILWDASRDVDFEEQPLRGLDGAQDPEGSAVPARGNGVAPEPPPDAALARRSWLTVAFASGVWAGTTYSFRPPSISSTLRLCNLPARLRPSSSCIVFTRFRGGVSPQHSRKISPFSFLAFCSPRSH
ncbi:hypothetical protein BC826DRAFT_670351 [Russula brevipes]|nr:hypothetical protein BC826DRAFT_670351 [Russula brevipes]